MEFRAVQVGENMEVLGGWCVQRVQECSTSWCKLCCGWRGLILGSRSCVSPLITQEIPRVSGTPCQELGTKTKYLFFIIAPSEGYLFDEACAFHFATRHHFVIFSVLRLRVICHLSELLISLLVLSQQRNFCHHF